MEYQKNPAQKGKYSREYFRVSNMLQSNARFVLSFIFGDFYVDCRLNKQDMCFDIKVRETLKIKKENGKIEDVKITDYIDIEAFKKHFGKNWRVIYDKFEEA